MNVIVATAALRPGVYKWGSSNRPKTHLVMATEAKDGMSEVIKVFCGTVKFRSFNPSPTWTDDPPTCKQCKRVWESIRLAQ